MAEIKAAPWTDKEVETLNKNQFDEGLFRMHPYTCGNERHVEHICLVATNSGWICPSQHCNYKQNWAHEFSFHRRN